MLRRKARVDGDAGGRVGLLVLRRVIRVLRDHTRRREVLMLLLRSECLRVILLLLWGVEVLRWLLVHRLGE